MAQHARGAVRVGGVVEPTTALGTRPGPLSPAAVQLVDRAWGELRTADRTDDPAEEYVLAHLAALRGGAAMLAARGRPRLRGRRALNVWDALVVVAPELQDWATCFAACAARRAAAESGRAGDISAAEASDHLARAGAFLEVVSLSLGLPVRASALPLAS